jgi:hypothetical protein
MQRRDFLKATLLASLSTLVSGCTSLRSLRKRSVFLPCPAFSGGENFSSLLTKKLETIIGEPVYSAGLQPGSCFLSFCLPGIPFSVEDLNLACLGALPGIETPSQLQRWADFSRLANFVSDLSTRWQHDGRLLWNEYETVLTDAVVASDRLSTGAQSKYEEAKKTVSTVNPEYQRYSGLYDEATSRRIGQCGISNPGLPGADPESLVQLCAVEQAKARRAYQAWIVDGHKKQYEEAASMIGQVEGRAPLLAWQEYKERLQSPLGDLNGQRFWPTTLAVPCWNEPASDAYWTKFTVHSAEESAGQPGSVTMTSATSSRQPLEIPVTHLTVELMRAEIVRPWFNPGLFRSRYWRWPDAREPLSDGAMPPRGRLVACSLGMIFARRLEATLAVTPRQEELRPHTAQSQLSAGPLTLNSARMLPGCNAISSDGIHLIAFVSQLLPRSPNPDPGLIWD